MNVLELIKQHNYIEAAQALPCWIYNENSNRSIYLTDIRETTSLKKSTVKIEILYKEWTKDYISNNIDSDESCYGACEGYYDEVCHNKSININLFKPDNYIIDVEATHKQRTALSHFNNQLVTHMSKRQACKTIGTLIEKY